MTARRGRGEGGLHFDESRQRWIATAALGFDARGKRITRKASGTTKTAAKAKLREILRDHAEGLTVTSSADTVEDAVRDWLAYGLAGRSAATVANYTTIAEARIIAPLGRRRLRDLSAEDVDRWLRAQADAGQHPNPAPDALDPQPRRRAGHGAEQGPAQRRRAVLRSRRAGRPPVQVAHPAPRPKPSSPPPRTHPCTPTSCSPC